MSKPLFEICCIGRNEVKTIPRLNDSLAEYKSRGGVINYLDTGSQDGTQDLARSFGWRVKEVGEKFLVGVPNFREINNKFRVEGEPVILKQGDRYFNFSAARNECAEMATQKIIFWYDCDEVAAKLDIDFVNQKIQEGFTQFEYWFVFAFDQFGGEAVKFMQCKAYDKTVMQWTGRVHELVSPIDPKVGGRIFQFPEDKYKLAHYQNQEQGRHSYLIGLSVDCFEFPHNDRHSHYFARELFWSNRPKSALKEFKRHINLHNGQGWAAERAESLIFMAHIYGTLNDPKKQAETLSEAFFTDSGRNKALVELALFYRHNQNYQAAICYAKAALEIPFGGFYAEDVAYYTHVPNEILYQAYGRMPKIPGYIDKAKFHLLEALKYQPYNPHYLRDTQFYFDYPDQGHIQGWMRFPELQWLYEQAKSGKYKNMFECGSWKGKSTHALLSGLKNVEGATLTCVDTWAGSSDERDDTHHMAKKEDVYGEFIKNTKDFANCRIIRAASIEAAKQVPDGSIDWCFIDMGHTYNDVIEDLDAWYPKVKKDGVICGHDFTRGTWQEVVEAVTDFFEEEPHEVVDSIWIFHLSKLDGKPKGTKECKLFLKKSTTINDKPLIHTLGGEPGDITRGEVVDLKDEVQAIIRKHEEKKTDGIPKKVWTCWFGDEMPELVKKCIDSQAAMCAKFGYDFQLITLDFIQPFARDYKYLNECLGSQHPNGVKYCKMTDYLRMLYLKQHGGWFLDADIEILPGKSFDDLLGEKMVVGLEEANWEAGKVVLGTAIVGAVPYHPMIIEWLETVERDHVGWDNRNYESSMDLLNKIGVKHQENMKLLDPEVFFPKHSVTREVNITPRTITVHHFLKTWTPQSTLQQFKYNIENNINFTFVKRGDGEVACMNGETGGNCDGHPYSKELGDKLKEAYQYLQSVGAHIVDFEDQKNYNVLLHRTDNNLQELSDFYKAIRDSKRPKFLLAPNRLKPIASHLNAWHDLVSEINAFAHFDLVLENIPIYENGIYMFCAGMPAKAWIHEMSKRNPNATYLDCGSAFDPSISETRTMQITKEQFWELYAEKSWEEDYMKTARESFDQQGVEAIMAGNPITYKLINPQPTVPITNNFNLPQETHPERLWVIDNLK